MIEKYLSGFFLLLSGFYFYFATDISIGTLVKPKAGFLPHVVGGLAIVLSAINFYKTIRKQTDSNSENSIDKFTTMNICFVMVGTVAYITLLSYVGYLISTALYIFYLLKVTRTKGFMKPAILSLGVVFTFYFFFATLLEVALP